MKYKHLIKGDQMDILSKITVVAIGILAGMYLSGCGSDNTSSGVDNGVGSCVAHNGTEYCDVTSPYTGKIWLDRNLGAAEVCIALDDTACYGDYYQWGRNFDGHQNKNSETTDTLATDVNNAGNKFITGAGEWTSVDSDGSIRHINWSKIDGSSVSPAGYRIPTKEELVAETIREEIANSTDIFDNFLKLPYAGFREDIEGELIDLGKHGFLWSSSMDSENAYALSFVGVVVGSFLNTRSTGYPARCIKN